MSFNPGTGLVYVPAQQVGGPYIPATGEDAASAPIGYNTGIDAGNAMYPRDAALIRAATAGATGALVAWDPVAGRARWRIEYPTPWNGGTMTTAGNLVFQGTALGEFRAYAADSGRQLLAYPAGSGIMAGASTFVVGRTQYVAVLTGRGGALPLTIGYAIGAAGDVPNVPRLLVFRLGGKVALPPSPPRDAAPFAPPAPIGSAAEIAAGRSLYGRYCQVCHRASAAGGGVLPDLQRAATLADAEAWKSILIDGALQDGGMVSFKRVISPGRAESIRRYVIDEANWAKRNLATR